MSAHMLLHRQLHAPSILHKITSDKINQRTNNHMSFAANDRG
jgi:hypothetical protein